LTISNRLFFGVVAMTITMMSINCNQNNSNADHDRSASSLGEFRSELEAGSSQPREEPFVVRSYRPALDDKWIGNAVAYGCYRSGQAPGQKGPSDAELLEDLKIIAKHWHLIRLYGADDDTRRIIQVIDEYKLPIKVILGVWLQPEENNSENRSCNITQASLGIELANRYPNIINALCAGNETQVFWSGHRMKPENLIRYIRALRKSITIPVTTADDYLFWDKPESKQVADEIDFVFTHIHPLWNGKTLEQAIDWFDSIYHTVQEVHPDRPIVIGETGWATAYDATKTGPDEQGTLIKGEVSIAAQAIFLSRLVRWIESNHVTTFLFEAFDEPWKGGGESSTPEHIEKHWGVFYEDRTPKESFLEFLKSYREDLE